MRPALFLIFTVLPFFALAQSKQLQQISRKQTNEVFEVLQSDTSVRSGSYELSYGKRKPALKGQYSEGKKTGIWESYNADGSLRLRYDFGKEEWHTYHPDQPDNRIYRLAATLSVLDTNAGRAPIALWSQDYLWMMLVKNLRYPAAARESGISGKVLVSFIVDKYGHTSHFEVKNPVGYDLDQESIRVLQLLPDLWLPGTYRGQPVDVEVTMPLTFRME